MDDWDLDAMLDEEEELRMAQEQDQQDEMPFDDEDMFDDVQRGKPVEEKSIPSLHPLPTQSGGPSSSLRSPQVQVPLTTREGIHDEEELESIGSEGPATTTSGNTSSRARLLASRLNREGLGGSPLHSTTELEADVNKQDWRRSRDDEKVIKRRKTETDTGGPKPSSSASSSSPVSILEELATRPYRSPKVPNASKYLLTSPPVEGQTASVVTSDNRLYFVERKAPPSNDERPLSWQLLAGRPNEGSLLSLPMATLMEMAEKLEAQQAAAKGAKKKQQQPPTPPPQQEQGEEEKKEADSSVEDHEVKGDKDEGGDKRKEEGKKGPSKGKSKSNSTKASASKKGPSNAANDGPCRLWVDKYSPKTFSQLLSDEAINREVLRVLRGWDEHVFHRAVSADIAHAVAPSTANKKSRSLTNQTDPLKDKGEDKLLSNADSNDKRPQVRAVLLCGPPGTGKTTLAHVLANHCGYRPFEINASDDRSPPALREKLSQAMQNRVVIGDQRPTCIILDEVDGIDGKGSMKLIVDMIKAPLTKEGKKTGNEPVLPLTRPLICICNDLYAPQIRGLRDVCTVFRFRETDSRRLAERLKTICHAEGLSLTDTALTALCKTTSNDIRLCLNTLQFFKTKANKTCQSSAGGVGTSKSQKKAADTTRLSQELIQFLRRGLKDNERDLIQLCSCILRKAPPTNKEKTRHRNMEEVFKAMEISVDSNQILEALHENLMQPTYMDAALIKTSASLEWLAFADQIMGKQLQTGDYYVAAVGGIHLLCQVDNARPRIIFPRKDYEARQNQVVRRNILQSFMDGCSLKAPWSKLASTIVLDVASCLLDIVTPKLRAINPDLFSPREKAAFRHLIQVLSQCGLTFGQAVTGHKTNVEHGAVVQDYELLPALDKLVTFGDSSTNALNKPFGPQHLQRGPKETSLIQNMRRSKVQSMPVFVKQVVAQEVKMEAVKRNHEENSHQDDKDKKEDKDKSKSLSLKNKWSKNSDKPAPLPAVGPFKPQALKLPEGVVELSTDQEKPKPKGAWFQQIKKEGASKKRGLRKADTESQGATKDEEAGAPPTKKATVRFKYQPGFTNAIRRPVYMRDLL